MIVRTLAEDIFIFDDSNIDERRRVDLMSAMAASFDQLIPILVTFLSNCTAYFRAVTEHDTLFDSVQERLTICTLEALAACVERMPLK